MKDSQTVFYLTEAQDMTERLNMTHGSDIQVFSFLIVVSD